MNLSSTSHSSSSSSSISKSNFVLIITSLSFLLLIFEILSSAPAKKTFQSSRFKHCEYFDDDTTTTSSSSSSRLKNPVATSSPDTTLSTNSSSSSSLLTASATSTTTAMATTKPSSPSSKSEVPAVGIKMKENPIRVMTLGDSNTRANLDRRRRVVATWPTQLYRNSTPVSSNVTARFTDPALYSKTEVFNFGIPGSACSKGRNSTFIFNARGFEETVRNPELDPTADTGKPENLFDVVTIAFGTNDARDYVWSNKSTFIDCLFKLANMSLVRLTASRRRQKRIIVLTPPPAEPGLSSTNGAMNFTRLATEVVPAVREAFDLIKEKFSSRVQVELIDVFEELPKRASKPYTEDGMHLNKNSGKVVSSMVVEKLLKTVVVLP